jgi:hypothetical protein
MWEDIITLAVGNGLWAVLSCVLLRYLLKDSRKRECKYTQTIETLGERLKVVLDIKQDLIDLTRRGGAVGGAILCASPRRGRKPCAPPRTDVTPSVTQTAALPEVAVS